MIRLAKLITALLLAIVFIWGCNGTSPVAPDRQKYQADKPTGQAEKLKGQALQRLEQSLNAEDMFVRMQVIESCAELGLPNAPKICIQAISSGVPSLEFAGAMGLIEMPNRDAKAALKKLLSSSDASVRLAAIGALHRVGQTEDSGELVRALSSRSAKTRGDALTILGRVGDESAIPAIRGLLEEDNVDRVQWQAAEALVLLGDEKVLPRLQRWQYVTDWQARTIAVQLMGQVRDRELFVADLLGALEDQNQLVQLQAARSLGRLGHQDGFRQALRYLDPTASDRTSIATEMAVGAGEARFTERISQIRSMAALALGEIGNWDGAPSLAKALNDRDPRVALAAAHAALRLLQKQQ